MLQIAASLTIVIDDANQGYEAKVKHNYSTGAIYNRHLRSPKYVYNTCHWWQKLEADLSLIGTCVFAAETATNCVSVNAP
jgi:hypothetical protein